jgi:hypothetical protein
MSLKRMEKAVNGRIKGEREMYTHYPVPSEVQVSKALEISPRVDVILYSHCTEAMNGRKRPDQHVRSFQI